MTTARTKPHTGRNGKAPPAREATETLRAAGVILDEPPPPRDAPPAVASETHAAPTRTPELAEAALYGLAGDIIRTMAPHTEAATPALLGALLVTFGAAVGRGAWMTASGVRHHPNLFTCIIGASSRARKSTAAANVRELFVRGGIAPPKLSGLSSGEGLIHHVRDAAPDDEKECDSGVADKRLCVVESELGRALAAMKREGNTLSAVLREAWDGSALGTIIKRESATCAEPHVSLVACVTAEELKKRLDETELWNGLGNRILWLLVTRPHLLPLAGELPWRELAPLLERLAGALTFAQGAGEILRSPSGTKRWCEIYATLAQTTHAGAVQALTDRAEAQVLRLSMIHAMLDRSRTVNPDHLDAALALWRFAEASVLSVFGGLSRDARNVFAALADAKPGELALAEISERTGRHIYGERLGTALAELASTGQAAHRREASTGGRPRDLWHAL